MRLDLHRIAALARIASKHPRVAAAPVRWLYGDRLFKDYFEFNQRNQWAFAFKVGAVDYTGTLTGQRGAFEVEFEAEDTAFELAGTRPQDSVKVFSTVLQAVREKQDDLKMAFLLVSSVQPKRSKLYRKFAQSVGRYLPGWELVESGENSLFEGVPNPNFDIDEYNLDYRVQDYAGLSAGEISESIRKDVEAAADELQQTDDRLSVGRIKEAWVNQIFDDYYTQVIHDLQEAGLGGVSHYWILKNQKNVEWWEETLGGEYGGDYEQQAKKILARFGSARLALHSGASPYEHWNSMTVPARERFLQFHGFDTSLAKLGWRDIPHGQAMKIHRYLIGDLADGGMELMPLEDAVRPQLDLTTWWSGPNPYKQISV